MKPTAAMSPIFSTFGLKFITYLPICTDSASKSTSRELLKYKNKEDLNNICFQKQINSDIEVLILFITYL